MQRTAVSIERTNNSDCVTIGTRETVLPAPMLSKPTQTRYPAKHAVARRKSAISQMEVVSREASAGVDALTCADELRKGVTESL